jgi:hypothetical protein
MKVPKPSTPEKPPVPPSQAEAKTVNRAHPDLKTSLRLAAHDWEPPSIRAARDLTMECVGRAKSLANVLAHACQEDGANRWEVGECLELLEDLLYLGYGPLMDWWDDEAELTQAGWTPPQGKEVQP